MLKKTILLILFVILPVPLWAAPALWQVDVAQGRFWLMGSVHVGEHSSTPALTAIAQRLSDVDTLVEEVPPSELQPSHMQQALRQYGLAAQGLKASLSAKAYQRLSQEAKQLGVPMAQLEPLRPWLAVMTLMQLALKHAGLQPELGIDMQLSAIARQHHWQITGLETVQRQFTAVSATDKYADAMVNDGADDMKTLSSKLKPVLKAWQQGDIQPMRQLCPLSEGQGPAYQYMHDVTLKARNLEWLPKLKALAEGNNKLVVVGMAHIICTDGLLSMLKQHGAHIQRLQ